jgi:hypothetical protein
VPGGVCPVAEGGLQGESILHPLYPFTGRTGGASAGIRARGRRMRSLARGGAVPAGNRSDPCDAEPVWGVALKAWNLAGLRTRISNKYMIYLKK